MRKKIRLSRTGEYSKLVYPFFPDSHLSIRVDDEPFEELEEGVTSSLGAEERDGRG